MRNPKGQAMPQVIASWVERFATRLIELQPEVRPLDAVRNATAIYPDVAAMAPEAAAEHFVSSTDGKRVKRDVGPTSGRS
jgi:hypothetical protein